jgi:ATP-dependent Clp protease adaptor protein ClpS
VSSILGHLKTEEQDKTDVLELESSPYHLIVWNDDVNTFEWVIQTLIEVCGHEKEQAEQCTLIIHFKGKCSVKTGEYEMLKPMCEGITDRGIGATIEELVS